MLHLQELVQDLNAFDELDDDGEDGVVTIDDARGIAVGGSGRR